MAPTSKNAATSANPSNLPPRFELRQLEDKHIPWAAAIILHSNLFCSPLWRVTYPDDQTKRVYDSFETCKYLARHQITSGHSYGVFDTEYQYKYPESEATEGSLYWNTDDLSADRAKLLEQMDFPLCSIALAYDGISPLDFAKLGPLMAALPAFGSVYFGLNARDARDPATWKPTAAKQVLMRNATSTREDYEGHGLMKRQAQWLMRHAAGLGFRGANIECVHDAVRHVWEHPPSPFKAVVVSEIYTGTYEEPREGGAEGEMWNPFGEGKQMLTKIYVDLNPKDGEVKVPNGTPVGALG